MTTIPNQRDPCGSTSWELTRSNSQDERFVMHITKNPVVATSSTSEPSPTLQASSEVQSAFDFFNRELFSAELPDCLITFQRSRHALGFFMGDRFGCINGHIADEIALNPRHFKHRTFEQNTSTLVHEMAHHWQHHFGKPGKGAYHNKEWARKMEWLGLEPFSLNDPKMNTGRCVSHQIVPGGRFQIAAEKLRATSFVLSWFDDEGFLLPKQTPENVGPPSLSGKRTKFICPGHVSAWAKPTARLLCGICNALLRPQVALLRWGRSHIPTTA